MDAVIAAPEVVVDLPVCAEIEMAKSRIKKREMRKPKCFIQWILTDTMRKDVKCPCLPRMMDPCREQKIPRSC